VSKQRFRGALNAAQFPLVSTLQGRTVVQPQLDNNVRTTQAFYGTAESADYSIPQLLYCENVFPTAEGLMSVGFTPIIPALVGASLFDQAITLRDEDENNFLFAPAGGLNYIYTANAGVWVSTNPIDGAVGRQVSRAYVNGRTFICYQGLGIYEYVSGAFTKLALTGIAEATIDGIGGSNNYLVAFADIIVYWSSLINPTDFAPSITTGAGFSIPQDVKAKITAIVGTAGGFIIYTAKNAVAAVYTNNIRAPFTFKEIANAGGLLTYEQVTGDSSSGPQYAWTTGGLQMITTQKSEPVSAEVNDFFAGKLYETWNATTKQLVQVRTSLNDFAVKITYIGSRFLVLSYGFSTSGIYSYALILDTTLKRWGKIKLDHVDCFNYPYPNLFGDLAYDDLGTVSYDDLGSTSYDDLSLGLTSVQPSKRTIGFLQADGAVQILVADYSKDANSGVAIFGKFQLIRARMMTMQRLDIECVICAGGATVNLLTSLDGKNLATVDVMQLLGTSLDTQRYAKRRTGINFAVVVEGSFALTSYMLEVTAEGDR